MNMMPSLSPYKISNKLWLTSDQCKTHKTKLEAKLLKKIRTIHPHTFFSVHFFKDGDLHIDLHILPFTEQPKNRILKMIKEELDPFWVLEDQHLCYNNTFRTLWRFTKCTRNILD